MSKLKAMGEERGGAIFLIFFLIYLLDFIVVAINLIQLLAAILRINYLSIVKGNPLTRGNFYAAT